MIRFPGLESREKGSIKRQSGVLLTMKEIFITKSFVYNPYHSFPGLPVRVRRELLAREVIDLLALLAELISVHHHFLKVNEHWLTLALQNR